MTEDEFWDVIETAKRESERAGGGVEAHAAALTARLARLPVEEIVSFQGWFEYMILRAATAKTLAAHVLINDGIGSDDGYLYFRTWLVGQGEVLFKSAVKDPDLLADRLHPRALPPEQTDGELLRYAATYACQAKTGLADGDKGWPLDFITLHDVARARRAEDGPADEGGPRWIEKADIPKYLPKLAAKCDQLWSQDPNRPGRLPKGEAGTTRRRG